MAEIKGNTVHLTEQTIRDLVRVMENLKSSPYPPKTVRVDSYYSVVNFEIELELEPHTQESLGYKWEGNCGTGPAGPLGEVSLF